MGVELHGVGTVCHMGGRVDFTLCSQCQALGQALILSRQGRGGLVGVVLFARVTLPPRGYCLRGNDGHNTSTL